MNLEFDGAIAERVLHGTNLVVTVKLGQPQLSTDGGDDSLWYCPFRIEGDKDTPLKAFGVGVDSIAALISAIAAIGVFLNNQPELGLAFKGLDYLGFLDPTVPPLSAWQERTEHAEPAAHGVPAPSHPGRFTPRSNSD